MRRAVLTGLATVGAIYAAGLADVIGFALGGENPLRDDVTIDPTWIALGAVARIGLAHLVAGALLGVAGGGLARWAWPNSRWLAPVGMTIALGAWVYLRDIAMRPVFYEPTLYRSAWLRPMMTLATDEFGPRTIDVLGVAGIALAAVAGAYRRRARRVIAVMVPATAIAMSIAAAWRTTTPTIAPCPATPIPTTRASTTKRPNLLILGADSLRADRLGSLGAEPRMLPWIDRIAEAGVTFRDAYVPLARTLPSIATMLTGCDPHSHGLRHMFPPRNRRTVRQPALPRLLAEHGYRSEVVTDFAGEMFRLVDFGFDAVDGPAPFSLGSVIRYECTTRMPGYLAFFNHPLGHRAFPELRSLPANADPSWLADRLIDRIDALAGEPFCLFGFFSTTHTPYAAPWPGYRHHGDRDYQGANKYAFFVRELAALPRMEEHLDDAEVRQIRALYNGSCRLVDAEIGRVVEALRVRGLWENTIVVILSDHGEHLYEPGNTSDHGKWFRGDEANRIPLVLAGGPIQARGVVDGIVRGADVLPTLLTLLGIEIPDTVEGVDLGPRMRGEPTEPLLAFGETGLWLDSKTTFRNRPDALIYPTLDSLLTVDDGGVLVLRERFATQVIRAKHRAVRSDRWKLIYRPTESGVHYALYDVVLDPHNLRDVASRFPRVTRGMVHALRDWMRRDVAVRFNPLGHLVPRYDYFE